MNSVQVRELLMRILRIAWKVTLGLLSVLTIVLILIHLPPVQKQITRSVAGYLSSKLHARVDIEEIKFSLLGDVTIKELNVWDPNQNKILTLGEIAATSDMTELISGNLVLNQISIKEMNGKLIQDKNGLNIQFVIDAFASGAKKDTAQAKPFTIECKRIELENIDFEFQSVLHGLDVKANVGTFTTDNSRLATHPLKITSDQVLLQRSIVDVLTSSVPSAPNEKIPASPRKTLAPDFGTGIVFEINNLALIDDQFSFHKKEVIETKKFDPAHLPLKNIQLNLHEIKIHPDTLAATLQKLAVTLPGFELTSGIGMIQANRNSLTISDFNLSSGLNQIQLNAKGPLDFQSLKGEEHSPVAIALESQINPNDFQYFLSDSLVKQFSYWSTTELSFNGNYFRGKGEIKKLNLTSGNSELHVTGTISDVLNTKSISWNNLNADVTVGTAFKKLLQPFIQNLQVPPHVKLQLVSSGNLNKIFADGRLQTSWGDAKVIGDIKRLAGNTNLDIKLHGKKIALEKWTNQSWLGPADLSLAATGTIGNKQNLNIDGTINTVEILKQSIKSISMAGTIKKDSAHVDVSIHDPNYKSNIQSQIVFSGPLTFTNKIQLDSFRLGKLVLNDSTLWISGNTKSEISIADSTISGLISGHQMSFNKKKTTFSLDTLSFLGKLSPSTSEIKYYSENANVNLLSNFDLRKSSDVIQNWSENILTSGDENILKPKSRKADLNIEMVDASLLKLFGVDADNFTTLKITGKFDEQSRTALIQASTGNFKGYGVSLDTLNTSLAVMRDTVNTNLNVRNLYYDSIKLGNLDFSILTKRDTALADLLLVNDSITLLGFNSKIIRMDSGMLTYPEKLTVFNRNYTLESQKPVYIGKKNVAFDHFRIARDRMELKLNGDLNYFDVSLTNVDLTPLNFLLAKDTVVINRGLLNGHASYSIDKQFTLETNIDSLSLYNSDALTLSAKAASEGSKVPFELSVTNTSNKIDLHGNYFTDNTEVDASLNLAIHNPELFEFLVSDIIEKISGSLTGHTSIKGPIKTPQLSGALQFTDVNLTTVNPKLTFHIEKDSIELDNSSLRFRDFTLYDAERHPLTINGDISLKDYKSLMYDLHLNSAEYALINNPDSTSGKLRGKFVIDSDIKLKGDSKDKYIDATVKINDATNLTLVNESKDIDLITTEGIIDFVDPTILNDTTTLELSPNYYDSLLASLPAFNLNATINIEENAVMRLLIDEKSGDYLKASGSANLELDYDRTGNLQINGNYTIKKGVYRLSFYDLVKKNFTLVKGSSINWHGSAKNGDINIKAVHAVESNSLGLIGHEIGENEKSIYKRSLDYEVGINISGTIDKPIIAFSLDLPQNDKVSYPALANKLDRLRQPEYESELNKQVFGLLVLGGFLPESTGSDINSNLIATTAISNSVNSLLASQLNRFASQYIKGVSIDVGIQSFSDYSSPGGKTQTAMDFRVSKKMMNDRLSFEIGGDFDINQDQSGSKTGKNYRGDVAIIYDLTGNNDKQLKLFNNQTYDIIYQEIRNTGISLIFIREFATKDEIKKVRKHK